MKGHKAEVGVEERWVGIGEGELAKSLLQYYQFIEKHSANYTTKQEANWLGGF